MNFASKSVIHEDSLGSFTCRKAGTWDILFYFPSEGRYTEDFPDARKIPRTRVPVASMLTTRPPKPSDLHLTAIYNLSWIEVYNSPGDGSQLQPKYVDVKELSQIE